MSAGIWRRISAAAGDVSRAALLLRSLCTARRVAASVCWRQQPACHWRQPAAPATRSPQSGRELAPRRSESGRRGPHVDTERRWCAHCANRANWAARFNGTGARKPRAAPTRRASGRTAMTGGVTLSGEQWEFARRASECTSILVAPGASCSAVLAQWPAPALAAGARNNTDVGVAERNERLVCARPLCYTSAGQHKQRRPIGSLLPEHRSTLCDAPTPLGRSETSVCVNESRTQIWRSVGQRSSRTK